MIYSPDDFMALVAEIEHEGGYVQPDACTGDVVQYKLDGKRKRVLTMHCGLHARVAIPYDPRQPVDIELANGERLQHPGEVPAQEANFVPVCAVDDAAGCWPRYEDLMSEESHQPL